MRTRSAALALALIVLTGCGGTPAAEAPPSSTPSPSPTVASATATPATPTPTSAPTSAPTRSHRPRPTASRTATESADPRWRFFTTDRSYYSSRWYAGSHRIMIGYGCNASPWYDHDARCPGREGFHHGIDVTMPCGTPLYAGVDGVVLPASAPGTPGPAYGTNPLRIQAGQVDLVLGHTRTLFVHPGDRVHRGERIALASDSGAPDGCHLHFEVRAHSASYLGAVDPSPWLGLHRS